MAATPVARSRGVALEFRDLSFEVGEKRILRGISGTCLPGTLTLLMGPSGAGKTTLMKLLAQREEPTSGKILINGKVPTYQARRVQGYVEQEVAQFETLTTLETLTSTARLKLPESVKQPKVDELVRDVIRSLDIEKCKDTRISGCSGGEKRRLAVAAELLGDPSLLFLDEPTTGLDSHASLNILRILRRLARTQNRTIICTIHQPRASLLTMADQLVLLANGRQVYGGPTFTMGVSDGMLGYFDGMGFPCSTVENPADHVVDLVNARTGSDKADSDDGESAASSGGIGAALAAADAAAAAAAVAEADDGTNAEASAGEPTPEPALAAAPDGGESPADEEAAAESGGEAAEEADGEADEEDADEEPLSALPDCTGWKEGSKAAEFAALATPARLAAAAALRGAATREEFVDWLAEQYDASELKDLAARPLAAGEMPLNPPELEGDGSGASRYPTGCCTQTRVVMSRVFLFKLREPEAMATQALNLVLMAFIFGWVYFNLQPTFSGVNDRFGFVALMFLQISFAPIDLLTLFPKEREVFLRDSNANLYGTLAFYVGRSVAELPGHIGFTLLGATAAYWLVGFQADAGKFGIFLLTSVLVMITGASLMTFTSSLARTLAEANGLGAVILMVALMFNGFFIAQENTPVIFQWIDEISYLKLAMHSVMTTELSGLTIQCTAEELVLGCLTSGTDVLASRSLPTDPAAVWALLGWMVLTSFILRLLTFFALHYLYTGQPWSVRTRLLCEW